MEHLHTYVMDIANQQVWDFAGDGYVHRLIMSDSEYDSTGWVHEGPVLNHMKVVEISDPSYSAYIRFQRAPLTTAKEEVLVNRKLEKAAQHYSQALVLQLEQNRLRYESRLEQIRCVQGRHSGSHESWARGVIKSLVNEKHKLQRQCQAAKERCDAAKKNGNVLHDLNESLLSNLGIWDDKVESTEQNLKDAEKKLRSVIPPLEKKVRELMAQLE
jgi:BRCA1-associated protein